VAFDTVLEVPNPFLFMLGPDVGWRVFVAPVAGGLAFAYPYLMVCGVCSRAHTVVGPALVVGANALAAVVFSSRPCTLGHHPAEAAADQQTWARHMT